jgi:predicted ABC-type transport system involved in lysophospholipase L1 biosynthesis ATPase subunit
MLFSLVASHRRTMILVTHEAALAGKASRRFLLRGGVLVESG